MKKCISCNIEKHISEYRISSNGNPRRKCKECANAMARQWKSKNREAMLANRKAAHAEKIDVENRRCREYKRKNKAAIKKSRRKYYEANKDIELSRGKIYKAQYYLENKDKIIKKSMKYRRNRYRTDPNYKAQCAARWILKRLIERNGHVKKNRSSVELGYD